MHLVPLKSNREEYGKRKDWKLIRIPYLLRQLRGWRSWSFHPFIVAELVDHEITRTKKVSFSGENSPADSPSSRTYCNPFAYAPSPRPRGNLASSPTLIYLETVTNTIPIPPLLRTMRVVHVCEVTRERVGGESGLLKGLVLISSVDNTHSLIPLWFSLSLSLFLSLARSPTHLHPPCHPQPSTHPLITHWFSSASPSPQRTQQPLCTPTVLCLANNGPAPLTVHHHQYTYHHRSMHHCQASFSLTPINRGLLVAAVLNSARGGRVYRDNFLILRLSNDILNRVFHTVASLVVPH